MELPREIQQKIWDEVRFKMQKDKYNKVVCDLKRFVSVQRREKYYISKRDPHNQSMFMYLNFTLRRSCGGGNSKVRHFVYTWFIWEPYLDRWTDEPIRKPTIKLVLHNFARDLNLFYWDTSNFCRGVRNYLFNYL